MINSIESYVNMPKLRELLLSPIPKKYGTYNKICPNCLYRQGHNIVSCRQCHQTKMEDFSEKYYDISNLNYILRAKAPRDKWDRIDDVLLSYDTRFDNFTQLPYFVEKLFLRAAAAKLVLELSSTNSKGGDTI